MRRARRSTLHFLLFCAVLISLLGSTGGIAPAHAAPPAGLSSANWAQIQTLLNYGQQTYFKASNTGAVDTFGYSVAVSGDTVVVGAPNEDSNASGVNGDGTNNSAAESGAADTYQVIPTFTDVPFNYWSWLYVEQLASAGITGRCGSSNYCPETSVTRAQVAVFLLRGEHGSTYTPPAATGTVFADVPSTHWAAAWIEQLAAEGITAGCGPNLFCPDAPVTRDQMAVFLLRAEHGSAYAPPAPTGIFSDVPTDFWGAAWIEQLATEGITGGCGNGNYCPAVVVTRAQMAVFLVRTFNLP